jgi:hypothetical protein
MTEIKKIPCRLMPRLTSLIAVCILLIFSGGACKKSQPEGPSGGPQFKTAKLYKPDMASCNGFTTEDAAGILGLPLKNVKEKSEELYTGNWQCTFESGGLGKTLSFNVSVANSAEEAERNLQQYRAHLETAGSVSPFKENLPKGAYSDVSGLGQEAVWTDINLSLAVRQGNVTIRVTMPKDKSLQIKVAEKFLSKLK